MLAMCCSAGTIAGTIDDSFVTKSQLEVYSLDLSNGSGDMKLLGAVESKDCFHSISYGTKGMEDGGNMPHGIVAGRTAPGPFTPPATPGSSGPFVLAGQGAHISSA